MSSILRLLGIIVIGATAGIILANVRHANTVNATDRAAEIDRSSYTVNDTRLAGIQALLDANSGFDTSASLIDLQTGKKYHFGDTSPFVAASIGKLVTATLYLRQVELGKASLEEPIGNISARTALERLIVESDNAAWHSLNARLTTEVLQSYAKSQGLGSYNAGDNTVTSNDVALLLYKLAKGKLLNNKSTELLLSYMQRANMRDYIVAAVPDGATAYHKVGYLNDRLHDAAIIKQGKRSFVLVIFSKAPGSYNFSRGAAMFGEITTTASEAFLGGD